MSLNFLSFTKSLTFEKTTFPSSGESVSPTSSLTSRKAQFRLFSPFKTEPPQHSHINGLDFLLSER